MGMLEYGIPTDAEIQRLREMNIANREMALRSAGSNPENPLLAQQKQGMGGITGQITGGQRTPDGKFWQFIDQQGNVLTQMPLQEYYAKYGNQGATLQDMGMAVNGVKVWNPLEGTRSDPYRGATAYNPNAPTATGPASSLTDPTSPDFLRNPNAVQPAVQPGGDFTVQGGSAEGLTNPTWSNGQFVEAPLKNRPYPPPRYSGYSSNQWAQPQRGMMGGLSMDMIRNLLMRYIPRR